MAHAVHITGGKRLCGEVTVAGAKNAASKMLIATLLTGDAVTLENIPLNQETDIACELVRMLGGEISLTDHTASVHVLNIAGTSAMQLSRKNRLAILALAPLLHRKGEAFVPRLGGDKIGARPVNFHLDALESMGATIEEDADGYRASCKDRLRGTIIDLPYPSVGATETVLFAGVLARGRTIIKNAAIEPEIIDLVMMLQKMGAIIELRAGREIVIVGVEKLHGCVHRVLPDRLEVASFAALALGTRGDILVKGANHRDVITFLNAIRLMGGEYEVRHDGIRFFGSERYRGMQLETDTAPGFSTDWQQPMCVLLTQAEGVSVLHETVYEDRFGYTEALRAMGADISVFENCLGELSCRYKDGNHRHSAVIKGPTLLRSATVAIPDIRAGLAYILAALIAKGTSTLTGVEHLERGYENLYGKLQALGADITLV